MKSTELHSPFLSLSLLDEELSWEWVITFVYVEKKIMLDIYSRWIFIVRYTNDIVLYGACIIIHVHRCIARIPQWIRCFTAANKKIFIYMLYTFIVGEYGYRGPPARIRIFRHRNFSPDRPITHALCIPNAFWHVFSCMYAVRSHKTEVLISVHAPRIGRLKKTNSDITRRNSSWRKTFNVTIYSIIGGQSLKGISFYLHEKKCIVHILFLFKTTASMLHNIIIYFILGK